MNFRFSQFTPRCLLLLVGVASTGILSGALIGQYFFDLYPCHLCIYQRWPHGLVMAIAFVGFIFSALDKRSRLLLLLCAVILLVGAGIATYHAGVESGIFKGPDGCSASASGTQSLEELRAQIAGAALVSCSQAMAYIFGLSMAAWNAMISLVMVVVILVYMRKKKHDAAPR